MLGILADLWSVIAVGVGFFFLGLGLGFLLGGIVWTELITAPKK